ncbi:oxidoreductase [Amycolatopsis regifaucium]|uniref:Protochlorophyllide oxidoreductase n=1 Tax=Amycolatopsis regifaucium TaxID=546365 RepID=A0A154MQU8_9PSEU|nr:oxidoreductase [Amycolatopsis regifaucium]KZB85819.1 protochlorophyllide oxidoreductase [Amycolatopsis regifaucium]OKA10682.1 protochlorophyllide oxidoreductase [Amycolatopsis regifaucium]SFI85673.1 NAD(P)-dependent dehydrogenase, short-chain alcohol dehydrogenase family [Amycolatopsis regifaucium]
MAAHTRWTEADIPDQTGRIAFVTGANSGLGLRTAEVLAEKGARVLLGCRSPERGAKALEQVRTAATGAAPELVRLDLADLASVREAVKKVEELSENKLDLLINNAGVMATPRGHTKDGFETQFGTNHLGHAVLTWSLMPSLRNGSGARVVTVSSIAATGARLDVADPNFERRMYNPGSAYGQSKLSNQVFALELDRRLRAAGEGVISVAAHPGYTWTGLGSGMARSYRNPVVRALVGAGNRIGEVLIAQNARMGTLPQLFAATAPEVTGGDYIGPGGLGGLRGNPVKVRPLPAARSESLGAALWDVTTKLTGVTPDPA